MGQVHKSVAIQPGLARLINYHVYIGLCLLGLFFITPAWAIAPPLSEMQYKGWQTDTKATSQLYTFPVIQDGSRQVTLTAQAKSTGNFVRVLTVNNPPTTDDNLGNFFLLNMNTSDRNAAGKVVFNLDKLVNNFSLSASDIDANTYWDQVTIYGFASNNPSLKVIPVANNKYTASLLSSSTSNNGFTVRSTSKSNTATLNDTRYAQGVTFNSPVDQVVVEYGNYSNANSVPGAQLIRLTIDSLDVPFATIPSTAASCPAGHKKYYIGQNSSGSDTSQPLVWPAGQRTGKFTFTESSGDKVLSINFPTLADLTPANSTYATSPYYGSIPGVTENAINLAHQSTTTAVNHQVDVSVNRPVSQIGFVAQDVDSTGSPPAYLERVNVSSTGGKLTSVANFHSINASLDIVTALSGKNCAVGECPITATWGNKTAGTIVSLLHNTTDSSSNPVVHTTGYSDFYFCLAPPKVMLSKKLVGSRAQESDQFALTVAQTATPKTVAKTFTTQGSADKITPANSTSGWVTLDKDKSYTLSEAVVGGGSLNNYTAQYNCVNSSTGSKTVLPTNGVGSSFELKNLDYGDEITCEITNTTNAYIKGIVFHDIGAKQPHANSTISAGSISLADVNLGGIDTETPTANNANYFNGLYDSSLPEPGIAGATIRLYAGSCDGNTFATPLDINNGATVITTDSTGRYSIVITENIKQQASAKNGQLCLVETNASGYTIDSSENKKTIVLNTVTPASSFDFGDVLPAYQPLVLRKYQYAHDCSNVTSSLYQTPKASGTTAGFTTNPITDIKPERCIAYYIAAYNRGNLPLTAISITDSGLTSAGSTSYMYVPAPQAVYGTAALSTNKTASNVIDAANRNNPAVYNAQHVAKDITSGTVTTLAKQEVIKLWFNTVFSKGASN